MNSIVCVFNNDDQMLGKFVYDSSMTNEEIRNDLETVEHFDAGFFRFAVWPEEKYNLFFN